MVFEVIPSLTNARMLERGDIAFEAIQRRGEVGSESVEEGRRQATFSGHCGVETMRALCFCQTFPHRSSLQSSAPLLIESGQSTDADAEPG
jgi:hypothetical protein